MSCIAGVFHGGGTPVQPALIESMLGRMKRRAPDEIEAVCEGPVAIGQSFLRTGASGAEQPNALTLDGKVFITADARIDGRDKLLASLRKSGRQVDSHAPHAELILHAYKAFGERFLDHLIGDFAFAIWDARTKKLTCARDHFGVRPFYYFHTAGVFGFASDIDALLAHPAVSDDLDETAVADILMFGLLREPERTMYKDVRCLPPASRCELSGASFESARYWHLPTRTEIRYSSVEQYVAHFSEVFERAVLDRLPGGPVALQLSGGMDSPAIAAVAARNSASKGFSATAYHTTRQSLYPGDEETELAQSVADHLGIPMVREDVTDHPLFPRDPDELMRTSFPGTAGLPSHLATLTRIHASGARVFLSGYAADAVFAPSQTYYSDLLRSGRWFKLCRELAHYVLHTKSLSGTGLKSAFRPAAGSLPDWIPEQPKWVAADAGPDRNRLAERWEAWWTGYSAATDARQQLGSSWIQRQFEMLECLQIPVVFRYPFLDLRVVECGLAMPSFMLARKRVLRIAMAGRLPESILRRPKTVPTGDTVHKLVTDGKLCPRMFPSHARLSDFVDSAQYASAWQIYIAADTRSTWATDLMLQPIALGMWLSKRSGK